MSGKASSIMQLIGDLVPMAQVRPTILDVIDEDRLAQELAIARGTSRRVLRSPEDLAKVREERKAQEMLAAAEPASKAMKNVADAQRLG
jgi:hypothetical protein